VIRWARSGTFWPLAGLAAMVLVVAWRLVFTDGILARGDLLLYFYPYWEYRGGRLVCAFALGTLPRFSSALPGR